MAKEKAQISPVQLTFLIITLLISTADIFLPAFVASEARQDSWIPPILSTAAMLPIVWMHLKLYHRFEGLSLIEICKKSTGKVFGIIIGLLFVFYFMLIAWFVIAEMAQVINTAFMPITPPWVFMILSLMVAAYAVSQEIESIARLNEILLPLGLLLIILLFCANFQEMDFNYFQPVLKEGMIPPLRGGLVIMGWLCEMIVVLQILPSISKPKKLNRAVYWGLLITGTGILMGSFIYALFGPLTEVFLMPALEFARIASIGQYIRNLDILVMAIWITGIYVKIMVFYYAGTHALAQLFQLDDYKTLILPVGIFLGFIAIASQGRAVENMQFLHYIFPFYSLTMSLMIPGILILISVIRKKEGGQ